MAQSAADLFLSIEPVKRKFYGLGKSSAQAEKQFSKIFKVTTDSKEVVKHAAEYGGRGILQEKTQNASVDIGNITEGSDMTWNTVTHAGGVQISMEGVKDSKLPQIKSAFQNLGRATELTPEYHAAQFIDNGYTDLNQAWDGLALFSTAHLLTDGVSSYGNMLSGAAALEESSAEDVRTNVRKIVGPDGLLSPRTIKCWVVPSALYNTAQKLSRSDRQVGSANNDPSVVKGTEVIAFDYLTDANNWLACTNDPNGLFWDWREKDQFLEDFNILLLQKIYVAFQRSRHGCVDPRGVYGSGAVA